MKKTFVLLGISAALLAVAAIDPITLVRDVKVGDTNKTKLSVDLDFGGQTVVYSAESSSTVKEVKEGELIIEEASSNSTIDIDGQAQPAGNDAVATVTYDRKTGKIKSMNSDLMDDNAYRFANLILFMWPDKPVDTGTTWEVALPAESALSTPKTTFKYTVEGFEDVKGHRAVKTKFAITEGEGDLPAKSAGTMWVDVKRGFILKAEGTMENAPAAGMVINAKFKIEPA